MNPEAHRSAFAEATIVEAIQLVEEAGPLDDEQALRDAAASSPDLRGRVVERARILALRLHLQEELDRARAWAPWMLIAIVALVVIGGLALAGSVTGGGERRINVVVALASLLGVHLLSLMMWLSGLLLPLGSFNASFGWIWLALTARVAGGRRGQAPLLLRAVSRQLSRARLMPWALGFVSHTIWALSFAVVVAALLFALAFRNYTLAWETTILDPGFFVRGVQWLGWAPARLGFPVPDAQTVLAPLAGPSGQRAWALWLTGCIVVYGLLPRVLLTALSAGVWRSRNAALQPDLGQAYFRRLLARFEALAPRHIVDADPGRLAHAAPGGLAAGAAGNASLAIGFELPEDTPWPPPNAELEPLQVFRVDGSASARRELLDTAARLRPRRVLIGCHAASTPDRGTERFLRDLMAHSGECRLVLVGRGADEAAATRRWRGWLDDAGLERIALAGTQDAVAAARP